MIMKTFDRYPYLKHSTANTMTFKPAHKDTETPAGQVVSDDQGQHTLSDYIRTIKRAEAFDTVAAEKKLTFDEWFESEKYWKQGYYDVAKATWNAALKHGKV